MGWILAWICIFVYSGSHDEMLLLAAGLFAIAGSIGLKDFK